MTIVPFSTEDLDRCDELAGNAMMLRPDLEQMSLDEFLYEHHDRLTDAERKVMSAVLEFHPDYRPQDDDDVAGLNI